MNLSLIFNSQKTWQRTWIPIFSWRIRRFSNTGPIFYRTATCHTKIIAINNDIFYNTCSYLKATWVFKKHTLDSLTIQKVMLNIPTKGLKKEPQAILRIKWCCPLDVLIKIKHFHKFSGITLLIKCRKVIFEVFFFFLSLFQRTHIWAHKSLNKP